LYFPQQKCSKILKDTLLFLCLGYHTAPELYRNEAFDSSVDAYSFGFILYEVSKFLFQIKKNIGSMFQMLKSVHTVIHSLWCKHQMVEGIVKTPEDSGHSIRFEGARPSLKGKLKGYPPDFKA
jgi:hypothetical protein